MQRPSILVQHLPLSFNMPAIRTAKAVARRVAFLVCAAVAQAGQLPLEQREGTQVVHEYFNLKEAVRTDATGKQVLNGFLNYTHLGTDFGFLGPATLQISDNGA